VRPGRRATIGLGSDDKLHRVRPRNHSLLRQIVIQSKDNLANHTFCQRLI